MLPDPKEVLALATQIVETKSLLGELNRKWESMFSSNGKSAPNRLAKSDNFTAKVRDAILATPGKSFTIAEVARILNADSLKVGRTLFRLAKTKKIDNPKRGKYRAKQQEATAQ